MNFLFIIFIFQLFYLNTSTEKFKKTSSSSAQLRIIGGRPIEVPDYFVALIPAGAEVKGATVKCSSTLISDYHLLTTARCYRRTSKSHCQMYDAVFKFANKCTGNHSEVVPIKYCYVHPNYDPITMLNDIAIAVLNKKVYYTPAMLPVFQGPQITIFDLDNKEVSILGYGNLIAEVDIFPCMLRIGQLDIMLSICRDIGIGSFLHSGMLCAVPRHNINSPSKGEAGGGLIFDHGDSNLVIGVISFGVNEHIVIFTYVPYFMEWIQSMINGPRSSKSKTHKKLKTKGPNRLPSTKPC